MGQHNSVPQVVTDAVERGTDAAEEIHKAIAAVPFDWLRRVADLGESVDDVQRVHDRTVGAVYDLVRGVNREVGRLAEQVLEPPSAEPSKRRPRHATAAKPAPHAAAV